MSDLATLSFQPEAYETAAEFFKQLAANGPRLGGYASPQGYTVDVVPKDGEPFTAEVLDVVADEEDGQYKLVLAEWDDAEDCGDLSKVRKLDLYDDLVRVEVC